MPPPHLVVPSRTRTRTCTRQANPSLACLELRSCHLTPVGVKALARLLRPSAASSASLSTASSYQSGSGSSSSDFGDIGVDFSALRLSAPCARLVEFDLGDNHLVGSEGAAHIADSLRDNVALRELRLDGCGVGDDGAIFVAGALAVNGSLRELRLQRNRITECGAASLADAIKVWVANTQSDIHNAMSVPFTFLQLSCFSVCEM